MNRREFLSATTAMASVAMVPPAAAFTPQPLRALPRFRRLYVEREERGSWLFYSDGPTEAQQLVRFEVIERTFGAGTYATLSQPDHWRMIEEGWFAGGDLHQPLPIADPTHDVWRSFYHPVVEAHDLLSDALAGLYAKGWRFACTLPNGLTLAEHPSTPRYATARARSIFALTHIAEDVERQSRGVVIVLPKEIRELSA